MVLCKMVKFHEIELSLERNKGGDEIFRAIHEGRSWDERISNIM